MTGGNTSTASGATGFPVETVIREAQARDGETWARKRGYPEIASDAETANEASILLHGRRGFAEVGRTVHFVKEL